MSKEVIKERLELIPDRLRMMLTVIDRPHLNFYIIETSYYRDSKHLSTMRQIVSKEDHSQNCTEYEIAPLEKLYPAEPSEGVKP